MTAFRSRRLPLAALALVVVALLVAACGGSDAGSDTSAAAGGAPASVSAAEAGALFEDGSYAMVDVREPDEIAAQSVEGALQIPLGEIEARMDEIPNDRPVLVLCRSGNRAVPAAEALRAAGYEATVVNGGIIAWADAGLPYTGSSPS